MSRLVSKLPPTNLSVTEKQREQWYMALSYLWILFIIPLIRYQLVWHHRNADYAFHLKQGATLFFLEVGVWFLAFIPVIGTWLYIICGLGLLFLALTGFLATWNGEKKVLPLVGIWLKSFKL